MTVWYHGTRAGFRGRGGLLLPKSKTGAQGTSYPVNPGMTVPADAGAYCYVTRDREVAEVYAEHAPGRGRPKVLTVQPHGDVTRDPEHGPGTDAWRCESATVLKVEEVQR